MPAPLEAEIAGGETRKVTVIIPARNEAHSIGEVPNHLPGNSSVRGNSTNEGKAMSGVVRIAWIRHGRAAAEVRARWE